MANKYAVGSNQYQKRPGSSSDRYPTPTLHAYTCGEVWGTKCKAKIYKPSLRHSNHPHIKHWTARLPQISDQEVLHCWSYKATLSVSVSLLKNPHCDYETLTNIVSSHPDLLAAALAHPGYRKSDLMAMIDLPGAEKSYYLFLSNPNCDGDVVDKICDRSIPNLRNDSLMWVIARHPQARVETLMKTLERGAGIEALVQRTDCPAEVMEGVSLYGVDSHRAYLAINPATPEHILIRISQHSIYMLDKVLQNPNCPEEILRDIVTSGQPKEFVDRALQHKNCPAAVRSIHVLSR